MFLYNDKHNRNRRKVSISKSNFSPNEVIENSSVIEAYVGSSKK